MRPPDSCLVVFVILEYGGLLQNQSTISFQAFFSCRLKTTELLAIKFSNDHIPQRQCVENAFVISPDTPVDAQEVVFLLDTSSTSFAR